MCNQNLKEAGVTAVAQPATTGNGRAVRGGGNGASPRSHWLEATIYPGERERVEAIAEAKGFQWVSILHDLDTKEGGELKAAHIHLLCHFDNARTVTALAKDFQVPAERIVVKDSGQGALAYLTHNTDRARLDGKHQYPVEALRGSLAEAAAAAAESAKGAADEGRQVCDILDWLDSQGYVSTRDVARWAAREGRWAVFRRAGVIFKSIIEEHNADIMANQAKQKAEKESKTLWEKLEITQGRDPMAFQKMKARQTLAALGVTPEVYHE